jgi:CheY-like chemotaxis protein
LPSPAKLSLQPNRKKLILYIDDDRETLHARKLILRSAGYHVMTASSGRIGLRILERYPVQLVILDYRMPEMKRDAVAREIRRARPHVPILMLSGQIDVPKRASSAVGCVRCKGAAACGVVGTFGCACGGRAREALSRKSYPCLVSRTRGSLTPRRSTCPSSSWSPHPHPPRRLGHQSQSNAGPQRLSSSPGGRYSLSRMGFQERPAQVGQETGFLKARSPFRGVEGAGKQDQIILMGRETPSALMMGLRRQVPRRHVPEDLVLICCRQCRSSTDPRSCDDLDSTPQARQRARRKGK